MSALGEYMHVKIQACIGGTAVRDDIAALRDGVHVVVGTPGRVLDMMQRGVLRVNKVSWDATATARGWSLNTGHSFISGPFACIYSCAVLVLGWAWVLNS